ncbi:MAG: hypothetical protein V4544_05210, partial [Pseudomonadota bacterium]
MSPINTVSSAFAAPVLATVPDAVSSNVLSTQPASLPKSVLIDGHDEHLSTPTSLYVEKEKAEPYVLIMDDEPAPEATSGPTALYIEEENDNSSAGSSANGTKAFLCSDHEKHISKTTLCSDSEGRTMEEEKIPETVKSDSSSSKDDDVKEDKA